MKSLGRESKPEVVYERAAFWMSSWTTDRVAGTLTNLTLTNEQLAALIDLGLRLGAQRDPRRLLHDFCHSVRQIIGCRFAVAGLLANDVSGHYCVTSGLDAGAARRLGTPDPWLGGTGRVLAESRCLRLNNPGGDPATLGFPDGYPPVHSWLGAPIASFGRCYGWLGLVDKSGADSFGDDDERLVALLADRLGQTFDKGSLGANLLRPTLDLEYEVSERKRVEEEVRANEEKLRSAFEYSHLATVLTDLLTVVNGYGELVLHRLAPGDPARELTREMVKAGDRAAALIRQLLAFSRKTSSEPRTLDLRTVVADVDKMLRRILGVDIQLVVAADPDLWLVTVDAVQIEQVIMILVVNARDAMASGGRLTIEVRNVELDESHAHAHDVRSGPHVLLTVSDTGCGMDQATLAHLFEPFFTTKGDNGAGLGLATVKNIVKQAGGHAAVESNVGRGTTVKIFLPATKAIS